MTDVLIDKIFGASIWNIYTGLTSDFSASVLTYPAQSTYPFLAGPFDETIISAVYFFFSSEDCSLIIKTISLPPIPSPTPSISLSMSLTPSISGSDPITPTPTTTPTRTPPPSMTATPTATNTATSTNTPTASLTMSPTITTTITPTSTPSAITGVIDGILTGSGTAGGAMEMIISFDAPLPGNIIYSAGFDFTSTSGAFLSVSNGYPLPRTYPNGGDGCGITAFGVSTTTITTQNYTKLSTCAEPGAPYGYISKIVFWNVTLPSGYTLQLRPARANMTFELR